MKLLTEQFDRTVTEYDFIEVLIGIWQTPMVIKMLELATADVSTNYFMQPQFGSVDAPSPHFLGFLEILQFSLECAQTAIDKENMGF